MQMTRMKNVLSLILCMVLIAAMALFAAGCGDTGTGKDVTSQSFADGSVLGEGETAFSFTVTDGDGNESSFEIRTNKTTVGEALLDVEIIAGEDGEYGLYVKSVNGIAADYDADGAYWAFYINGEYAMSGVDTTDVEAGAVYSFKVES